MKFVWQISYPPANCANLGSCTEVRMGGVCVCVCVFEELLLAVVVCVVGRICLWQQAGCHVQLRY